MASEFVLGLFLGLVLGAVAGWRLRLTALPPPEPAPPMVIQASWQTGYAQGYEDATQQLAGEVGGEVEAAPFNRAGRLSSWRRASWTNAA